MKKTTNKKAFDTALSMLGYRSYSETEIRTKLRRKGYEEEKIAEAIDRLIQYGYLNDRVLGDEVFEAIKNKGIYGDAYIHRMLAQRGLSSDRHLSRSEEETAARRILEAKIRVSPEAAGNPKRLAGFLVRRGFPVYLIMDILTDYTACEENEPW